MSFRTAKFFLIYPKNLSKSTTTKKKRVIYINSLFLLLKINLSVVGFLYLLHLQDLSEADQYLPFVLLVFLRLAVN